jgi:hypothetical protein
MAIAIMVTSLIVPPDQVSSITWTGSDTEIAPGPRPRGRNARVFPTRAEYFAPDAFVLGGQARYLEALFPGGLVQFLPLRNPSISVVRAILFTIVLTLTVGPNGALLCKSWCEPQTAESACHHDGTAPGATVSVNDRCDNVELSDGDVLLNEVRRGTSDTLRWAAHDIEFTPDYQLSRSTTDARPGAPPGRARSLDDRPVSSILRI